MGFLFFYGKTQHISCRTRLSSFNRLVHSEKEEIQHRTEVGSTYKVWLEELFFNLIFPSHNGIPQEAANLFAKDAYNLVWELQDNNQFEYLVERELLKCGKTVFADEHRLVLLEYEYLKQKYRNVSFFVSEQIWPHKRFWEFKTIHRRLPIILESIKALISSGIYFRALGYFETSKYIERA